MRKVSFPRTQHTLPVRESNQDSATFRLLRIDHNASSTSLSRTMFLIILFSQYLKNAEVPIPACGKGQNKKYRVKIFSLFPVSNRRCIAIVTKGPFGLRVKLPPAHLSTKHGGGFELSLSTFSREAVTVFTILVCAHESTVSVGMFNI